MTASSTSTTVRDDFRSLVAGRMVVLVTAHPAAGASILRQLHGLGADRILVLGPPGLAPLAAAIGAELVEVDLEDEDSAASQRYWEALLDSPPSGLRDLLDARDPGRGALVLVSPRFATTELLGRPVFGAQRPGWAGHEDTLLANRLWAAAGIPAIPSGARRGVAHVES
jgi:hypothetical protein